MILVILVILVMLVTNCCRAENRQGSRVCRGHAFPGQRPSQRRACSPSLDARPLREGSGQLSTRKGAGGMWEITDPGTLRVFVICMPHHSTAGWITFIWENWLC